MGIGTAGAALVGAAAPGIAQGISQIGGETPAAQQQANGMLPTTNALSAGAQDSVGTPALPNPLTDPNHPAWGIMANLTGGQGGPLPGGNGNESPQQLQNGGVVRQNFGKASVYPEFTKGPAIPTGPNNTVTAPPTARMGMLTMEQGGPVPPGSMGQGITPGGMEGQVQTYERGGIVPPMALPTSHGPITRGTLNPGATAVGHHTGITDPSTAGQILSMDAGGVVPTGFVQQPGITGVPMSGRGAALVEGLQAGQNLGHNIQQAWQNNEAHWASSEGAGTATSDTGADVGDQSPLGKAKNAVESFFTHLHGISLDDNSKPNASSAVPNAGAPGAAPATPGVPGAAGPVGAAPAAVSGAAGVSPAGTPVVGAANATGATPAPASQPSGAQPGGAGAGGQPSAQQSPGVQPQVTQQAAQSATQDPQIKSGTPDKTPAQSGLPHSLTTYQWDASNKAIQKAVMAAANAGEDPQKVYESLTAMRTAHIQGQVLRQYGAANVALQNGDMDAVKQALSNANYYLPNGQGITFKTANAADVAAAQKVNPNDTAKVGDLMYRNPFYGMFGHENDNEYQTVTPLHLQMLGAAALDPRTVNQAITGMYTAQQEAQNKRISAQGELATGQGRYMIGQSDLVKAGVDKQLEAGRNYLNVAGGELKEAQAGYWKAKAAEGKPGGQLKVTMNDYDKAGQEAVAAVRGNVQGKPRIVPGINPTTGALDVNASPGMAGKSAPSPAAIPSLYQGMQPDTQQKVENLARQLAGSNIGVLPPQEAGDVAARVVHFEESGGPRNPQNSHLDPATHQQVPNVRMEPEKNAVHVWVGNRWQSVWGTPNLDTGGTSGGKGSDEALPVSENEGEGQSNSATNDFPNA